MSAAHSELEDVDHIGYYLDPSVMRHALHDDILSKFDCDPDKIRYIADAATRVERVKDSIMESFGVAKEIDFQFINHHLAHAASAFYTSGFEESAILTLDGSGDRETCVLFKTQGPKIEKVLDILVYPESLGFIYTVIADHLGLGWIEGPGKLMGLAGYGRPNPDIFESVVNLRGESSRPIEIDLSYFGYHRGEGLPPKALERFGNRRTPEQPITQAHCDLASSTQKMLEDAVMHVVRFIPELAPGFDNLCLAGGVALNVGVNRDILDSRLFRALYVPPPAYDGGTSLGCALYLASRYTSQSKFGFSVYCGPDIERDYSVSDALSKYADKVQWAVPAEGIEKVAAKMVSENKIVGWAQGRMECGPRALGNRSILANAMNPGVKDELNARVKHRESFRPYSPSVLREECLKWFDMGDSPYMLIEGNVREEKKQLIPGAVHVDGTSRVQTVSEVENPIYYRLLREFQSLTGVPMVINTSFNQHGEPIVNRPEEAIEMLLSTKMDALFLGPYYVTRIES